MRGAIAAGSPETAAAGAELLAQGGNAVDAAVAAAFASFIAEGDISNIGGCGFALVCTPQGEATVYDFFANVPGLGRGKDRPLDFQAVTVDFGDATQVFHVGRASAAVPGNVAGLCTLLEEQGTMPLSQVLAPAIRLAREGFHLAPPRAFILKLLEPIFTYTPSLARRYTINGRFASEGDLIRMPRLAETLEWLAQEGPDLFYTGPIGQAIVADQEAHGGLITAADLAYYRVYRCAPIRLDYRGHTILMPPPPSTGGALIAFSLKLLESLDLSDVDHASTRHLTILAEVMRLTNQARQRWEALSRLGGTERVTAFLDDAVVASYCADLTEALARPGRGSDAPRSGGPANTTHISVADRDGLIVSLTTTPGESAGFIIGETGVTLNNLMGEADLHPRGFHQDPPGIRLASMMAPTIVLEGGRPVLALGSGGSNRLRTAILQVLNNLLDFPLSLEQAVLAPRVHFEEGTLHLEGGYNPLVADELEAMGYQVNRWRQRSLYFGGVHAVSRQNGTIKATGDPRRGGAVVIL